MADYIKKHKTICAAVFGALSGFLIFLLVNTAAPLDVTDDSWILRGYAERDIIQHYTGWLFYRDSHINFPLGIADAMGNPGGGAVAFSDSIPIVSVIFGLFSNILPPVFQFFGIYSLLCYMLIGVSAALLLCLFFDAFSPIIFGTLLFCVSPVMIERAFRHTALASHYLIVFALYLYFKNRKTGFRTRWGYVLLCFLAAAIHFYFVPMILAVLFADLLQDILDEKRRRALKILKHTGFLALNIAFVFLSAWLFGYFYSNTAQGGALGYGYFTMNLNSLFNPKSVSGIDWSFFLPAWGQGLGSAEGFNYLGFGVLAALAAAFVYCVFYKRKEFAALIKRHLALVTVSVILTVFAVSTTVVINNNAYIRIELPLLLLRLFSTFRSSGRMFWPVSYLLLLFSVIFLARKSRGRTRPLVFTLLALVQFIDLSPALAAKRHFFTSPEPAMTNPVTDSFFSENRGAFDEIFTFSEDGDGVYLGLYVAHYAVTGGMVTNEPFLARNDVAAYQANGDAEFGKLMSGDVSGRKLYLFDDENRFFNAAMYLGDSVHSGKIPYEDGRYYVIAAKSQDVKIPENSGFIPLSSIPLTIADYSDLVWTDGVLDDDRSVVTFYDNAFTARFLENAEYLTADGKKYKILNKDYGDPGWVMVTLDTEDARPLIDKPLLTE